MALALNKYNSFSEKVVEGNLNLPGTIKVALSNTTPSVSDVSLTDITEISAGNGYTAGGEEVSIGSSSQTGGTYELVADADTVFTASGGAIAQFRYLVLYESVSELLVGWWDHGSAVDLLDGTSYVLQTNGVSLITLS